VSAPIVAYYRVSTDKQGKSGHGLEAQRATVEAFAKSHSWPIVAEFTEVETGKRNDRPQLNAALKACKKQKARLVIAKLDRLSRKLSFITMLIDSNIDFVCCDNPHATKLTLHILGAMGEHERDMISKRTKEALAAAKQRGVVLGNPNVGKMNSDAAMARDAFLRPILETMLAMPLREIAQELNNRNIPAPRGGAWGATSVMRVMKRLGIAAK
jgi:DNA invertase Pin-like site-specific DNA recombinase